MSTVNLEKLNKELKGKSPLEIIKHVLTFAKNPLVTTNFRPYEVAILHACSVAKPNMKVIWCDTGYNTPQTYKHACDLIDKLQLNMHLYVPKQSVAYRDVLMGIPSIDDPMHKIFTNQVKLEPFNRAMEEHKPDVWLQIYDTDKLNLEIV